MLKLQVNKMETFTQVGCYKELTDQNHPNIMRYVGLLIIPKMCV